MYFAKFRHIRYLSHLLQQLKQPHNSKKQSFLENKFEYFEIIKKL